MASGCGPGSSAPASGPAPPLPPPPAVPVASQVWQPDPGMLDQFRRSMRTWANGRFGGRWVLSFCRQRKRPPERAVRHVDVRTGRCTAGQRHQSGSRGFDRQAPPGQGDPSADDLQKFHDGILEGFRKARSHRPRLAAFGSGMGANQRLALRAFDWRGTQTTNSVRLRGFLYVYANAKVCAVLSCTDAESHYEESLKLLNTSLMTFRTK